MNRMKSSTHTLVIGGGFAGATAAQTLANAGVNVTLVDRKDYFEVTFAMLRNVTEFDAWQDKARVRYRDFVRGSFVQAGVVELSTNKAWLDNGDEIGFEQAIIASGSSYSSLPIAKSTDALTLDSRHQELQTAAQSLAGARSVLIVGGGAVGVELAGDIAYKYPLMKVTLADANGTILKAYSKKTQRLALQQLLDLRVDVKTERRFVSDGDSYVDAASGESIQADIVYVAVGVTPNSGFMQKHFSNVLNKHGYIGVNEFYQVQGTNNLYAVGDVADLPDLKLGALAAPQARKLADNLIGQQAGKKPKPHKPGPVMGLFPIGQQRGVAQLPFGTVTWKLIINLKNKDMFIGKMLKDIGAPTP
jgi:NADH dehydrogenase FAD-containing subunit